MVRVKRWCKRPPLEAQATRHGKPHRVQGQIGDLGAARSEFAKANGFRVLAAETNDSLRSQGRRQKSAYSLSKTIFFGAMISGFGALMQALDALAFIQGRDKTVHS